MNVIGIEPRRTYTVVGLQEADQLPQLLSDGQRSFIPNIVAEEQGLWGSEATSEWPASWTHARWTDASTDYFWQRLQRHIAQYLSVEASLPGYQTVVVSTATERVALSGPTRAGRFGNIQWIDPPRAALARWLTRRATDEALASTMIVVTVGDQTAECAAFVVRPGQPATIERASRTLELANTGVAWWTQAIIDEVLAAHAGPVDPREHFALWQTASEFGERLRRARVDAVVPWFGPLEDRFHSPVGIRAETVQAWESMATLTTRLPHLMQQALAEIGADRADLFLLAGAGATWPIPFLPAHAWPAPVRHDDARADLAIGATLWPRVREHPPTAVSYLPPTFPASLSELADVPAIDEFVTQTPSTPPDEFDDLFTKHLNEQEDSA